MFMKKKSKRKGMMTRTFGALALFFAGRWVKRMFSR